jgi:hypothetical protein
MPVCQMKSADRIKSAQSATAALFGSTLLLGAALLLGGCVTEVGYESPPPAYEASSGDIDQPPPPLPQYAQPPCPGDGYLWVPGYWAYSGGYYWVPGTWVLPPQVGYLWTPGYWGFAGGVYVWHSGYWGRHVGFYGRVPYGYGYDGDGYRGGRWQGPHFVYNRYVTNVDVNVVHYTYVDRVNRPFAGDRVSYDGGRGGIVASPTREELTYAHEEHLGDTPSQRAHIQRAAADPALFERANNGHPPVAATPRPGHFEGSGVERARGAESAAPQPGRSNGQPRPSFPSRPNVQERANTPARPNPQPRARTEARPPSQAQRPAARPQPPRQGAQRRGPGRSQGSPAARKNHRPPPKRDH